MQPNHHPDKTLGRQAAHLVVTLHERDRRHFTLGEAAEITGLPADSVRSFMRKLVDRGVATRLRPGLFSLVPFELGAEREYLGNPYLLARELAAGSPYYLSHASAMDLHRMVTQPQLVVYVTLPRSVRPRTILGTEFRFVKCPAGHMFGTTELWVDGTDKVVVSDLERTIIDGLRQPQYCGGTTEVAKGLWMRRSDVRASTLVDYALRLGVGAVLRRVGYLLELYDLAGKREVDRLRNAVTTGYILFDPTLPAEGRYLARWRLRLNVEAEELQSVVRT